MLDGIDLVSQHVMTPGEELLVHVKCEIIYVLFMAAWAARNVDFLRWKWREGC